MCAHQNGEAGQEDVLPFNCVTVSAGVYVDEGPDRDKLTAALAKENYIPVYLDHRTMDLHYNGFCNSVLWQLFHYVPLNMDSKLSETRQAFGPINQSCVGSKG